MDDLSVQGFKQCPECGGDNPPGTVRCWLCGAALAHSATSTDRQERPVAAEVVNPYRSPPPPPVAGAAHQFRLSTLFLIVTVACLGFGLWHSAPGLTILLLIIAVPALARASAVSNRMADGTRRLGFVDVLIAFAMSFALVILVLIASIVAFCIACFAAIAGFGERAESIAAIVWTAVLSGIAAFIALMIATWPRRKRD